MINVKFRILILRDFVGASMFKENIDNFVNVFETNRMIRR